MSVQDCDQRLLTDWESTPHAERDFTFVVRHLGSNHIGSEHMGGVCITVGWELDALVSGMVELRDAIPCHAKGKEVRTQQQVNDDIKKREETVQDNGSKTNVYNSIHA